MNTFSDNLKNEKTKAKQFAYTLNTDLEETNVHS